MPMKWMANQIKSKQQEKEQKKPQRKILARGTPEFIEREQKMLEMFDEGLTIDVIAERLGLTSGTIRHHVEYARGKGAIAERMRKRAAELNRSIIAEFESSEMTTEQVAEKLQISLSRVRHVYTSYFTHQVRDFSIMHLERSRGGK